MYSRPLQQKRSSLMFMIRLLEQTLIVLRCFIEKTMAIEMINYSFLLSFSFNSLLLMDSHQCFTIITYYMNNEEGTK